MEPRTILVRDGNLTRCINIKDLIHVQCEGYLCTFTTQGGVQLSHSKSLSFYTKLLQPYHFTRISRSTLINVEHVSAIKSGIKNRKSVLMSNGDEFPIAFRRWKELKDTIKIHNI